jgi:hypothetical protein
MLVVVGDIFSMRRPKGSYLKLTPDPTAVFSLDSSHPQRSSIFSGAVALVQCTFSGFEPQTRVFGYTPAAAKGKNTYGSLDAENVPSLAAVSITLILRTESLTWVGILNSGVLRGARRTLRTAHPITSSLSDAASNPASLPALHSTEAAFCRLRAPRRSIRILLPLPRRVWRGDSLAAILHFVSRCLC